LAIRHRSPSGCSSELIGGRFIAIGRSAPVLGIVLPIIASAAIAASGWLIRGAVAAVYVAVAVEIVIVVDRNVVVAAPPAAVTPASAPRCSHGKADSERNRHSRGIVSWRRIVDWGVGIDRWAVDHDRIIRWYIHDLWISLFDHDHTLALDDFGFDLLLFGRFQIAVVLGLLAHALHGIHYIGLLRQECVTQVGRPLNVIR
jgi:hypothetical protein